MATYPNSKDACQAVALARLQGREVMRNGRQLWLTDTRQPPHGYDYTEVL